MTYGRAEAIWELRRRQESVWVSLGLSAGVVRDDVIEQALALATRREREATIDGGKVRAYGFSYPLEMERKRWARTRDIIQRVAPGPLESPNALEFLARQAASIEMILRGEHTDTPNTRANDVCDRVLIGTLPSIAPEAKAVTIKNHFTILLTAGLIDFVYQIAKAVVLSWDVRRNPSGGVSARGEPDDMDRVLAVNPRVVSHALGTYVNFLFHGLPRVEGLGAPPMDHQLPLTVLINFNERFVLAHEYSHTLFESLGFDAPDDLPRHAEELGADWTAFELLAESGWVLDRLPPNVSLQGAFFVFAVLETLRRATDIARFGEVRQDAGFASHPPLSLRRETLLQWYRERVGQGDDDDSVKGALMPSRSATHLWSKIEEPLRKYCELGLPLHAMWGRQA